jgi:hypothetical protein
MIYNYKKREIRNNMNLKGIKKMVDKIYENTNELEINFGHNFLLPKIDSTEIEINNQSPLKTTEKNLLKHSKLSI